MDANVALRKESVDRNSISRNGPRGRLPSLSARRAWIEIGRTSTTGKRSPSLSARRAWIEIRKKPLRIKLLTVALRKESVDRNKSWLHYSDLSRRRSPQGERG